jgi:hypothetical protein
MYTEPTTGISFYTSMEADGSITGDGSMSTVSQGGFTFGMALPGNAATVDSHEYIGLIVCISSFYDINRAKMIRLDLWLMAEDGQALFKVITLVRECPTT